MGMVRRGIQQLNSSIATFASSTTIKATATTTFLSQFHSKLSDVRFSLKPSHLRPEHASCNRLCSNAIKNLASLDHTENLRHFCWKNGGGMDRIDKFRISEDDVVKSKKKCKSLKTEAALSNEAS